MKYLFLFLISVPAFSMPTVGDYAFFASYDGYTKEAEILTLNNETKQFQVKYTTKFSGAIIDEVTKTENADDMMTEEKVEYILANCGMFNGHNEDINSTLGNFKTCKVSDMDTHESFNIGLVPFGVLAMEFVMDAEPDATMKKFTLQKYRYGH